MYRVKKEKNFIEPEDWYALLIYACIAITLAITVYSCGGAEAGQVGIPSSATLAGTASNVVFPGVSLYSSASQTVNAFTASNLTWNIEQIDILSTHSTTTNPDLIIIPSGYRYALVTCSVTYQYPTNPNGWFNKIILYKNNSDAVATAIISTSVDTDPHYATVGPILINVTLNDTIACRFYNVDPLVDVSILKTQYLSQFNSILFQ